MVNKFKFFIMKDKEKKEEKLNKNRKRAYKN